MDNMKAVIAEMKRRGYHVWDSGEEEREHPTPARFAICNPEGGIIAWSDYEDEANKIVGALNTVADLAHGA